eukprot:6269905-Prymnesium_polylepis.1
MKSLPRFHPCKLFSADRRSPTVCPALPPDDTAPHKCLTPLPRVRRAATGHPLPWHTRKTGNRDSRGRQQMEPWVGLGGHSRHAAPS